jgi:predicted DNA-binding protein (MmcQ/YjbR family)
MMQVDDVRAYGLRKPGATEEYPFGPEALVAKVGGKMFLLLGESSVSLKADPHEAEQLRADHPAIQPGYHLNKRHWITVTLDGSVPDDLLRDLIDESYDLVFGGLTKATRQQVLDAQS